MAVDIKEYERLKKQADKLQRDADQAEGALGVQMVALAELGCDSIAEGEALLAEGDAEVAAAELAFETALEEFKQEWQDLEETT